jgi:hypothetical protein
MTSVFTSLISHNPSFRYLRVPIEELNLFGSRVMLFHGLLGTSDLEHEDAKAIYLKT